MKPHALVVSSFLAVGNLVGLGAPSETDSRLEVVAEFPALQVTGVAVSKSGRIFVNAPDWSDQHHGSVFEVGEKGALKQFPDEAWNRAEGDVAHRFVCVQSLTVDGEDTLWILDAASPRMEGVVAGGPKLVKVDLKRSAVTQVIPFTAAVAPERSYLNDVRVDAKNGFAFITDSGEGALVVVNTRSGIARRVLAGDRSVQPEPQVKLVVEKKRLIDETTKHPPQIASDGVALDANSGWLYYKALTGRTLYRIRTADLEDEKLADGMLGARVEKLGAVPVSDGLEFREGAVWITALEENAIARYDVAKKTVGYVVRDPRLKWPDSLAWGGDGTLYVTTSQIHLTPRFNHGKNAVQEPFRLLKLSVSHPPAPRSPPLPGG